MTAHASAQSDTVLQLTQPRAQRLALLGAEEELLLFTAGGVDNDEAIRVAARGTIDWSRFLGLAQVERAVPVMFPRLRALVPDAIPAPVFDQMRRLAMVSDFAMLNLETRLRESLAALHAAKVRVMLLKGAALAHTAYSNVRQRPMSDVDILVDASNTRLARRVMLAAGWCDIVGGIPDTVYDRHHHLPPLRDVRSPDLQLEIHTALFPERQPFAFDARDLWARAKPLGDAFPDAYVPDRVSAFPLVSPRALRCLANCARHRRVDAQCFDGLGHVRERRQSQSRCNSVLLDVSNRWSRCRDPDSGACHGCASSAAEHLCPSGDRAPLSAESVPDGLRVSVGHAGSRALGIRRDARVERPRRGPPLGSGTRLRDPERGSGIDSDPSQTGARPSFAGVSRLHPHPAAPARVDHRAQRARVPVCLTREPYGASSTVVSRVRNSRGDGSRLLP